MRKRGCELTDKFHFFGLGKVFAAQRVVRAPLCSISWVFWSTSCFKMHIEQINLLQQTFSLLITLS